MSLGKRLKDARNRAALTQDEAAKLLGVTYQALSNYERDVRDPDTTLLRSMAELYNVSSDFLLERVDTVKETQSTYTVAAHHAGDPMDDLPEEAKRSLEEFKQYILEKYSKEKK